MAGRNLFAAETQVTAPVGRNLFAPQQPQLTEAQIDAQRRAQILREEAEKLSPLEAGLVGAGRGLATIGRGLGLMEPETPIERAGFEALQEERPIATTVGEIAGEAAPFLVPGVGVAGLAGRGAQVLGTAAIGATEAGLITRGKGGDVGEQLFSAGIGGTVASALELALPVLGRIGGKAIRRVLGKAPEGAVIDVAGNPSDELLDALSETGQTFDDIVAEAKDELSKKAVDPKQAARKAFLKSQGLDPTKAQISRNAADFQAQQEAAKTSGKVREVLEHQEAILTSRFNNAVLETGGSATAPTSSVFDALTEKATKLDEEISNLYSTARNVIPEDKNVKFNALTNELRKLAPSDRRAGGNISAIVGDMQSKGILDAKMNVVGRVNVEVAEDLRKLTNELYDPANPFGNMLLRKVKDKLDDDVFKAAGEDFFKQGRQAKASFEKDLSRAKISKFDLRKNNLVRDILENKIDPDQMVNKVIYGKAWRPDDLQQLKSYITTDDVGKQAFDDMRAEVMQSIKDRSFIGAVDDDGFQALSRDKLQKALSSIGDKKLNILFEPKETKLLKDLLQISKLREPVRGTALGRGPSAQAIGRIESAINTNPLLKTLVETITFDAKGRGVLKARPEKLISPTKISPARAALTAPAVAITQQEQQ